MLITRTSMISRKEHTLDIPVTEGQLEFWLNGGRPIQEVLPFLTADEREFLMTGITAEEWEKAFDIPDEINENDKHLESLEDVIAAHAV